jgi:hypothetical protein
MATSGEGEDKEKLRMREIWHKGERTGDNTLYNSAASSDAEEKLGEYCRILALTLVHQ